MNRILEALPQAVAPLQLLESLRARYAVKKFDPAGRIAAEDWAALEQALLLSPSSYGLQPWKFLVVENRALRSKLREASWGQSQLEDADKLVVFAGRKDFGPADIQRHLSRIALLRGATPASLESYKEMMLGLLRRSPEQLESWVARQVYLALGGFLISAALLGVDACPMEGFEPARYDRLLGLESQGYKALVVAAAGRRAADDGYAGAAKVRFAREEVISYI